MCYLLQNALELSEISLSLLAVMFNRYFRAALELHLTFQSLLKISTNIPGSLENLHVVIMQLSHNRE
jgi:hypothetical protein